MKTSLSAITLALVLMTAVCVSVHTAYGSWTPDQLADKPATWFDASDTNTITHSGGAVTQWADLSTNGYHLIPGTSPTTGTATIGGLNAIRFDGTNDRLVNPSIAALLNADVTMLAVLTVPTSGHAISGLGDGFSRWYLAGVAGPSFEWNVNYASATANKASWAAPSGAHIVALQRADTVGKAWMDGTLKATLTFSLNNNYSSFALGSYAGAASSFAATDVGELVIVPAGVPDDDRQLLEGYLAWKWGLEALLPAGHLYESAPPAISPEVISLAPADDTTVPTPSSLTATFSRNIMTNTAGAITISNATAHTVQTIPVGSTELVVSGAELTITPTSPVLANGTDYAVLIATNAIKDLAGNFFVGITNATTWNFTTTMPDTTAPTIVPGTFSPADGATDLHSDDTTFAVTFSENIAYDSGNIVITNLTDGTATIIPANDAQVTISTSNLTVNLDGFLLGSKHYAILIETNAIKDLAGNFFAGITDPATWNVTTAARVRWTPILLDEGLGLWLDASDTNTITHSGGAVTQWADLSTNGYHLIPGTSPTTGTATIGGLNAIRFDGVNDWMYNHSISALLNTDVTMLAVLTAPTAGLAICGAGPAPNLFSRFYLQGASGPQFTFTVRYDNVADGPDYTASWAASSGAHIVALQRTNTVAKAWMDGTLKTTLTFSLSNTYTKFVVGSFISLSSDAASSFSNPDVGELIIVPAGVSDADRQMLEGYLAWKWGLQASLPAGHLYESAPPVRVSHGTVFILQ